MDTIIPATQMELPKIFIACPAYGQIMTTQTVSSAMQTTNVLMQNGMSGGFGTLSYPDIVEIRNIFISIWYDKLKTSHLLFVDSDMGWHPDLIMDMIRFNKPLVGALCPKKKLPIEFAGRAKQGDSRIVNGFMEVQGIGAAISLCHRDVVTAMLEKWPELSDETTVKNHAAKEILESQGVKRMIKVYDKLAIDGETFSEDLSFCHRWKMCGGDVWANITHRVTHVGMYEFSGCYYDQIKDHIRVEGAPLPNPVVSDISPAMLPQAAE